MATIKGKRVMTSLYIDPAMHRALKALSERTRVPIAAYLREAVADLLVKHSTMKQKTKPGKGAK